jgi:nucleotide-binding universal stress UspA family protein
MIMFTHVLLPTDGSELSQGAVMKGILLAKESDAKVTGVCVAPKFHVLTFNTTMLEDTKEQFLANNLAQANKNLAMLRKKADEQGVPCETIVEVSDHPYEAIIQTAEAKGCDLVVMASNGRGGAKGLLLGSETLKVLTHSRIPVLVYR